MRTGRTDARAPLACDVAHVFSIPARVARRLIREHHRPATRRRAVRSRAVDNVSVKEDHGARRCLDRHRLTAAVREAVDLIDELAWNDSVFANTLKDLRMMVTGG